MNQVLLHQDKKQTTRTRHHSSDRVLDFDYHAMVEQQRQKLVVETSEESKLALSSKDIFMCEGLLSVFMKPNTKEALKVVWHKSNTDNISSQNRDSLPQYDTNRPMSQVLLDLGSFKKSYFLEQTSNTSQAGISSAVKGQQNFSNHQSQALGQQVSCSQLTSNRSNSINSEEVQFGTSGHTDNKA